MKQRYSTETSWYEHTPLSIWPLVEAIERFLLDRLLSDRGTQHELAAQDTHGDIMASTVSEARKRIEQECTALKRLALTIWTGEEAVYQGESEMAAILRVNDRGMDNYGFEVRFSSVSDAVARGLKVDFEAWLERRRGSMKAPKFASLPLPGAVPRIEPSPASGVCSSSPPQAADRQAALSPPEQGDRWWKANLHSIRDNLLASALWAGVVAAIGAAIAWIRLR